MKTHAHQTVTPKNIYLNRRDFLKAMGFVGASAMLSACGIKPDALPGAPTQPVASTAATSDELGNALTPFDAVTNYNNYYEFTVHKEQVAGMAQGYSTSPWQVSVEGLVKNPRTFSTDKLKQQFPAEERVYRLRCVEGWSMVIPWRGFPLAALLETVQPTAEAKFVKFTSVFDPDNLPGQKKYSRSYPWPYTEGLRLDEAQNPLTLMATGLYGEDLPVQDGAPLRLVVPWKYGFKSAKAIVKIELTNTQPENFWQTIAPNEYGFYANVNPEVPHPRWSQASERRIGEKDRRPTLMFNGYADQVADLYQGMDLSRNY